MTTRAVFITILFLLAGLSPAKAADPFFEGLAGNWRGSGFVRLSAGSQEENIRCKLSTVAHPSGNELTVFGTCALASFVLPVDGSIVARGGSAYSSTIFRTLVRLTTSNFTGKRRGSVLSLRFEGRDAATQQTISSRLLISKRGDRGFDVSIKRTDPASGVLFTVGTIKFKSG